MRSFFIKLGLFLLLLMLLDMGIGRIIAYYYNKISWGPSYRTSYALNKADQDVIILGSSRAQHHYIPSIMRDSLHMSCYNAGRDGQAIFYASAALKCILERKAPRLIILDVITRELVKDDSFYDRLSVLAPYYDTHPEIRPIVQLKGPFEVIKQHSLLYRYNSQLFVIAGSNRKKKKEESVDGYIPLYERLKDTTMLPFPASEYSAEFDSVKINSLKTIIADAAAAGSKLIVMVSPVYYHVKSTPNMQLVQHICEAGGVQFIDNTQQLQRPDYYCDRYHLSDNGAHEYTRLVLREIK